MPAWLEGEGMPSDDEALAWLEQLAEGKEEELRAQAQAEAEIRMAEIMGRPIPTEAPPPEAIVPPAEEITAAEEAPPPMEEVLPEEVAVPPAEEPFGWVAFGEPETPPEPSPTIEEAPLAEEIELPTMPELAYPEPAGAPPVVELPVLEEGPPFEEILAPEAAPSIEEIHWGVTEEALIEEEGITPPLGEGPPPEEIPAPEAAPFIEEVHWGVAEEDLLEAEEVTPLPIVEEMPGVVEMEVEEPPEEARAPLETPTFEVADESFAAKRAYLKQHPRDYDAWLSLARALWQASERQEALEAYSRVIRSGKLLESTISDLEKYMEEQPDASTQRVLGDAYMKGGQLQEALDTYRRALETL